MTYPHPALIRLTSGSPVEKVVDGTELVRSALEHHMFGLLWSSVQAERLDLDPVLKRKLALQDLLTQDRHASHWHTIDLLRDKLSALGVQFAVIKGVPTESRWYARCGERPCADVDIFLRPNDVDRAADIIGAVDPSNAYRDIALSGYRRGIVPAVTTRIGDAEVDIHLDPLKIGFVGHGRRELWDRVAPFQTPTGADINVLDTEATLFHALITLNRDGFCRLLVYSDVARIVQHETIDWDAFDSLARAYGLESVARLSLSAVADVVGLLTPVGPPRGPRAAAWRKLWPPSSRLQGDLGWARYHRRHYWLPALAHHGLPGAVKWWLSRLVLTPSLAAVTNPDGKGPWPFRLAAGRLKRRRGRRGRIRALR